MAGNINISTGTAIVLADTTDHAPGATAQNNLGTRTDQIDLTSLAAAAYRQSAKFDFGSPRAREWHVDAAVEPVSAPAAGGTYDFYVGFSASTTAGQGNPGNLTGSDAAYVGHGAASTDADECISQLLYVGSVVVSNDADIHVGYVGSFVPEQQYGILVVRNNTSVGHAADAVECSIRLSPVQDAYT